MPLSSRVVRAMVRDLTKSHDEIVHPERRRNCSLGRRYREKNAEISTGEPPLFSTMNDFTLFDRVASPSVTIEEMTELRNPVALVPLM